MTTSLVGDKGTWARMGGFGTGTRGRATLLPDGGPGGGQGGRRATSLSPLLFPQRRPKVRILTMEFFHFNTSLFLHFSQCGSKSNFRKLSLFKSVIYTLSINQGA